MVSVHKRLAVAWIFNPALLRSVAKGFAALRRGCVVRFDLALQPQRHDTCNIHP